LNKATRDIMKLLKLDAETAERVQDRMGENGLEFSECTQSQFDRAAREALRDIQDPVHEAAQDAYGKPMKGPAFEGADEEADFEQVASHLRTDAGLTDAEVVATGGNIDCILIHCGGHELFFGTAGEVWGASVYLDDEYTGDDVWTDCPSNETDPTKVALAITEAAMEFDQKHYSGEHSESWKELAVRNKRPRKPAGRPAK